MRTFALTSFILVLAACSETTYISLPNVVGSATIDGGVATIDGGIETTDGGSVAIDGGISTIDGGVVIADGGTATIDGGIRTIDGGIVTSDGGVSTIDGGVRFIDGGVTPIDGGVQSERGTLLVYNVANPATTLYVAGSNRVTLTSFAFCASGEDATIDQVTFSQREMNPNQASFLDYQYLHLEDAAQNVISTTVPTTSRPTFFLHGAGLRVQRGSVCKIIYLTADLTSICPTCAVQTGGHHLGFDISSPADVEAHGATTGDRVVVGFSAFPPNGKTYYAFKVVPNFLTMPLQNGGRLVNGSVDLYQLQVGINGATGAAGELAKLTAEFRAEGGSVISNIRAVDVTDAVSTEAYFQRVNIIESAAGWTRMDMPFNTPMSIAVNRPRVIVIRGVVSGAVAGSAIYTRLVGDGGLPTMSGRPNFTGTWLEMLRDPRNNAVIWSDRSASGHSTWTSDWTNGYAIPGLLIDSTPSVVSQ